MVNTSKPYIPSMRHAPVATSFFVALLAAVAFQGASLAEKPSAEGQTQSRPSDGLSASLNAGSLLHGRASIHHTRWEKDFLAGQKALQSHRYTEAEARLHAAWQELRKKNINDDRVAQTRLALGEAQLALNKIDDAHDQFTAVLAATRAAPGFSEDQRLRALNGATNTSLALQKTQRAQQLSADAMDIVSSHPDKLTRDQAAATINHAILLLKQARLEEATTVLTGAVQDLEAMSDCDDLLQQALYNLGLSVARQGDSAKAEPYFARAFAMKEEQVAFDRPARHSGVVTMVWEDGSPRARQMWDPEYPLKYVHLKNIRVATTIVRSENLVSVLISIANCGRERVQVGIGDVKLQSLSPSKKYLHWVDGNILDRTLEEDHVNNLTWRRMWLAHIQKTRRIPGYLKDGELSTDNFFGNNVFGPYGHWSVMAHTEPAVVTREQYYFDGAEELPSGRPKSVTAFANNSGSILKPTFLDPGDARTGVVFFQRERFDAARLQINLGNTIFEFPFSAPGGPSGKH